MISKQEMLQDIKEMLLLISAFTEPDTEGEKTLQKWQDKYFEKVKIK
jgi:hypothetical protein